MGLFGKSSRPDPKLQAQEWGRRLRKEGYNLDRQINAIRREETKIVRSIKESARRNDTASCRLLASEVVNARKTISRINASKAHLKSVDNNIKCQLSNLKVVGALHKSNEVMASMAKLAKVPELQHVMNEMSREMLKAGVIEEMIDDAMEGLQEDEELDEDVSQQVELVLADILNDDKSKSKVSNIEEAPTAPGHDLEEEEANEQVEEQGEEVEEDLQEMQKRLQALRT